MSIINGMVDASRDCEMSGGKRVKFTVSPMGEAALYAAGINDAFRAPRLGDNPRFDKFVLGVPVECIVSQAADFVLVCEPPAA